MHMKCMLWFESCLPSHALRSCGDFLLFSSKGRKVNGLRRLKESLGPSGSALRRFPGRFWRPVSDGRFQISGIFGALRLRPVRIGPGVRPGVAADKCRRTGRARDKRRAVAILGLAFERSESCLLLNSAQSEALLLLRPIERQGANEPAHGDAGGDIAVGDRSDDARR
jgi:hypothetical protein